MKIPDIDPELHGLIDEVVTDPRSALRRTPRRALLQWFGNPDSATARPLDATTAERHLVAVYRESLAELLLRASWLALHRQALPRMSPCRSDGSTVDMEVEAKQLQISAVRARHLGYETAGAPDAQALLDLCVGSLDSARAASFAEMALALAPSEFGQVRLASALPDSESTSAIRIFQQLAHDAAATYVRKDARNGLALRMLEHGWLNLAREEYRKAVEEAPHSPEARFSVFNLACWADDRVEAIEQSHEIARACSPGDPRLHEAVDIFRQWGRSCDPSFVNRIRRNARRWAHAFPEQAVLLIGAYDE
ncbi:MAG: hypothetical protein ABL998_05745 [Planctomycetota bacterium]